MEGSRFQKILIPIVPAPHAKQAIEIAMDFAQRYGAKLTFLYVAHSQDDPGIEQVKKMLEELDRAGVEYELKIRSVKGGEAPTLEILRELSEERYDLVIMSTRGYYGIAALVYESTSIAVALAANTSVLILR